MPDIIDLLSALKEKNEKTLKALLPSPSPENPHDTPLEYYQTIFYKLIKYTQDTDLFKTLMNYLYNKTSFEKKNIQNFLYEVLDRYFVANRRNFDLDLNFMVKRLNFDLYLDFMAFCTDLPSLPVLGLLFLCLKDCNIRNAFYLINGLMKSQRYDSSIFEVCCMLLHLAANDPDNQKQKAIPGIFKAAQGAVSFSFSHRVDKSLYLLLVELLKDPKNSEHQTLFDGFIDFCKEIVPNPPKSSGNQLPLLFQHLFKALFIAIEKNQKTALSNLFSLLEEKYKKYASPRSETEDPPSLKSKFFDALKESIKQYGYNPYLSPYRELIESKIILSPDDAKGSFTLNPDNKEDGPEFIAQLRGYFDNIDANKDTQGSNPEEQGSSNNNNQGPNFFTVRSSSPLGENNNAGGRSLPAKHTNCSLL